MRESFPCVSQAFDKALQILPVKKNTGAAPPINICYNRTLLSKEDVDYTYPESFNPTTGKQRLWVPLAANVALDETNSDPFYQIEITTFTLIMDSGKGLAQYITEGREDEIISAFIKTDQGFSFTWTKSGRPMCLQVDFLHATELIFMLVLLSSGKMAL